MIATIGELFFSAIVAIAAIAGIVAIIWKLAFRKSLLKCLKSSVFNSADPECRQSLHTKTLL